MGTGGHWASNSSIFSDARASISVTLEISLSTALSLLLISLRSWVDAHGGVFADAIFADEKAALHPGTLDGTE